MHVGTRMYQISNFNNAHAFTSGLLSTYSHLKWEFLNWNGNAYTGLTQKKGCVHKTAVFWVNWFCESSEFEVSLLSSESELNCDMKISFTLQFLCLNHIEFIWHINALLQLPSAAKYLGCYRNYTWTSISSFF